MNKHKPLYADLSKLPEDNRIDIAGTFATQNPGKRIAIITDDEPDKILRYVHKIQTRFPTLTIEVHHATPFKKAVSLFIEKKKDNPTSSTVGLCA